MNYKLTFLLSLILLSYGAINAQYWNIKTNDTLYYQSPVIIGNSVGENAMLSILSTHNNSSQGGSYGIISKHSSNHPYLQFNTRNRIGYSSNWSASSQGAAFCGALYLAKDNASSKDSRSAGGYFVLEFDNYSPYDNSNNIHYLGGSYNTVRGSINTYPNNSVIAAVIGEDQIDSDKSYAGYFKGKGYFSDNVGVGIEQPKSKLQIADGDVYISDINKGIIMKSPDGNCWRGTIDNSGALNFTMISCPDESSLPTIANEIEPVGIKANITIYPNPATKEITIDVDQIDDQQLKYFIYNIDGKLVQSDTFFNTTSNINIEALNEGVYLVVIQDNSNNKLGTERLVVIK